jgi:hypothetical protein
MILISSGVTLASVFETMHSDHGLPLAEKQISTISLEKFFINIARASKLPKGAVCLNM